MVDPIEILWKPTGATMPKLGSRALVDISDGDTPNIRMPIRMLSIDTPEVTAKSEDGARSVDKKFKKLAEWIKAGSAPVTRTFGDYIHPKLETGKAGTLQFQQGKEASAWFKERAAVRLKPPPGSTTRRKLFLRTPQEPFDS